MRSTFFAATLAAGFLLLGQEVVAADDEAKDDKLPEPALRFAKDANLRVAEIERSWQTLADDLEKSRRNFVRPERKHTEASLREEANRLLAASKKLIEDQKRIAPETERFRDTLKKAASHYKEVSVLYKSHAEKAKSKEVREDYLQLARVYESRAEAASDKARRLSSPTGFKLSGEEIEEGNLFIERLLETLTVGPVSEADCQVLAARLRKQAERCQAHSALLSQAIEKVLDRTAKTGRVSSSEKELGRAPAKLNLDPRSVLEVPWTSEVAVRGVVYRQILRFQKDGTCSQSVYRPGEKGLGTLLRTQSYTFKLDEGGSLSVYAGGKLLEWGHVTVLSDDRWIYEVIVNANDPGRMGSRITFTRHDGR